MPGPVARPIVHGSPPTAPTPDVLLQFECVKKGAFSQVQQDILISLDIAVLLHSRDNKRHIGVYGTRTTIDTKAAKGSKTI